MTAIRATTFRYEDAPLRRFHAHLALSGCGGQFADGFELGVIGIAVAVAADPLHLSAPETGLIGAAALAGLFFGSLATGVVADRIGRRNIFAYDMLAAAALSGLQFFATEAWHLVVLRLLLGIVLGADYVVSAALVAEQSPIGFRGRLLSSMCVAWTAGYAAAYVAGFSIRDAGADAWRWMLAASAVPSLCVVGSRIGIPESPLWLVRRGRIEEARSIVWNKLGHDAILPDAGRRTGGRAASGTSCSRRRGAGGPRSAASSTFAKSSRTSPWRRSYPRSWKRSTDIIAG